MDRVTIGIVGLAKGGAEMRLLIQDYEEMSEKKPRKSEEQNCSGLLEQAEAKKHDEAAYVHRITYVLVRTGGYELARRIEWRWSALPADDEGRYAGERQNSTGGY